MTNKIMVNGILHMDHGDKFYEACVLGKHQINYFPKEASYRAKMVLKLIYTDIYGPITPNSYDNHRYFITFIDDFSRRTWVYFLKEKSEVFSIFKKFKVLIENLSGERIKALRFDRVANIYQKSV
jgi:hypothetical protein